MLNNFDFKAISIALILLLGIFQIPIIGCFLFILVISYYIVHIILTLIIIVISFFQKKSKFRELLILFFALFISNSKYSLSKNVLHIISRHSYELLQSYLGLTISLLRVLLNQYTKIEYFDSTIYIVNEEISNNLGGISIANFININIYNKINVPFDEYLLNSPLFMHEYGHYLDSIKLGISYLFIIGLPSLISSITSHNILINNTYYFSHNIRIFERRANQNSEKYFSKHYNIDWKLVSQEYPTKKIINMSSIKS